MVAPLAVCAGLKVPQLPVGVQLQSTPALAVSFVTVAPIIAVPLTASVAGGAVVKEIAIVLEAPVMVTFATAVAAWLVVDAAVIITLPPAGAVAGAV